MNLIELEPRWLGASGIKIGISFLCPCCKAQRLAVFFENSIDHRKMMTESQCEDFQCIYPPDSVKWSRSGEAFETLTISPSVDASSAGHWHGFIQNGSIH